MEVKRKIDRRAGALGQLFARMLCKNEFRAWLSVRDSVCEDVIDCHAYDNYVKPVGGCKKIVELLQEFNIHRALFAQYRTEKQIPLTQINVTELRNKFCF